MTPQGTPYSAKTAHLILLIEDHPGDAILLQEAFQELGIPVRFITVATPFQAISVLRQLPARALPRLILIDLGLPTILNQHGILTSFVRDPSWQGIRKIVLTSNQYESDCVHALVRGTCSHLVKPSVFEAYLGLAAKLSTQLLAREDSSAEQPAVSAQDQA